MTCPPTAANSTCPPASTPTQTDTGLWSCGDRLHQHDTTPCGSDDQIENSLDVELSGAVATGAQIELLRHRTDRNRSRSRIHRHHLRFCLLRRGKPGCGRGQHPEPQLRRVRARPGHRRKTSPTTTCGNRPRLKASRSSWPPATPARPPATTARTTSYGNPYVAQYGLSVNGMASTPFNTAVGGTDFSWCQPYFNSSGDNFEGCATSSTESSGRQRLLEHFQNATTGASALGYVPEIPWNDTCENPILARIPWNISRHHRHSRTGVRLHLHQLGKP